MNSNLVPLVALVSFLVKSIVEKMPNHLGRDERSRRMLGGEYLKHKKASMLDREINAQIPNCLGSDVSIQPISPEQDLLKIEFNTISTLTRHSTPLKRADTSEIFALSHFLVGSEFYESPCLELARRYPIAYQLPEADTILVAADVDWRANGDISRLLDTRGESRVSLLRQMTGCDVRGFRLSRRWVYVVSNGYSPPFMESG